MRNWLAITRFWLEIRRLWLRRSGASPLEDVGEDGEFPTSPARDDEDDGGEAEGM